MKTIKSYITWSRVFSVVALILLIFISTKIDSTGAQTVTQGFGSSQNLQRGMIVSLLADSGEDNQITATTKDTAEDAYGVVVNANDSPVTLSQEGQQYFVATVGHFETLVSNQNGNISKGDYITISSVPGIGMKAGDKDPIAVGRALVDFDQEKDIVSLVTLKDVSGGDFQVSIARLPVQINISKNPLLKSSEPELPDALKKITETVAGKKISVARAYISLFVFLVSSIASVAIMYGGVRSAIVAVGRNPLSKSTIIKSMIKVVISGLIIFISGIFGVYLILRL